MIPSTIDLNMKKKKGNKEIEGVKITESTRLPDACSYLGASNVRRKSTRTVLYINQKSSCHSTPVCQ